MVSPLDSLFISVVETRQNPCPYRLDDLVPARQHRGRECQARSLCGLSKNLKASATRRLVPVGISWATSGWRDATPEVGQRQQATRRMQRPLTRTVHPGANLTDDGPTRTRWGLCLTETEREPRDPPESLERQERRREKCQLPPATGT